MFLCNVFSYFLFSLCLLQTLLHCTLSFSSKVYMVKCACCQGTMWRPVCKVSGNLNNSNIHGRKLWVVERSIRKAFISNFCIVIKNAVDLVWPHIIWQTAWSIWALENALPDYLSGDVHKSQAKLLSLYCISNQIIFLFTLMQNIKTKNVNRKIKNI